MSKKYIVVYTKGKSLADRTKDHYEVFVDEKDNSVKAEIFYNNIIGEENTITAALCQIIQSTDH